jgi:YVTN family beta-propeller protein
VPSVPDVVSGVPEVTVAVPSAAAVIGDRARVSARAQRGVSTRAAVAPVGAAVVAVAPRAVVSDPVLGLLSAVLSVFGLNSPTAPRYPLGPLVWGLFRRVETSLGVVPVAATPTVGTADPVTGVVTGSLNISLPAGLPLTYKVSGSPFGGSVVVNSDGGFVYTPTSFGTNTFTVTASDGLAATNQTVTVNIPEIAGLAGVIATIAVGNRPEGIAINSDGTRVYVANSGDYDVKDGNSVSVIDTATNLVVATVIDEQSVVPWDIAISPDGDFAYVTNRDSNTVTRIVTATDRAGIPIGGFKDPIDLAVSPDNALLYVTNYASKTVSVVDLAGEKPQKQIRVGGLIPSRLIGPTGLAISPDGQRVYVAMTSWIDPAVKVIDTATNKVVASISVRRDFNLTEVAVSPDATRVYVIGERGLTVIDTAANKVTATIPLFYASGLAISPDGTRVYATSYDGVSVIDTATNGVIATIATTTVPNMVAISPDGSRIYVTNWLRGTVSVISTGIAE